MQMQKVWSRSWKTRAVSLGCAVAFLLMASGAQAAVRFITGTIGIVTPSTQQSFARGPWQVLEQGTTTGTGTTVMTGAAFTLQPQGQTNSGISAMSFPNFAIVVQNTFSFSTQRNMTDMFAAGSGAAAAGPISFCPPQTGTPLQGNVACTDYAMAGTGNYLARIAFDQVRSSGGAPLANAFGGTLRMTRRLFNTSLWYAIPPLIPTGNTTLVQRVSKQPNDDTDVWAPGHDNFFFQSDPNFKGPQYDAYLTNEPPPAPTPMNPTPVDPAGKIKSIVAGPFASSPATRPPDKSWGFRATTGILSASDMAPANFVYITTGQDTVTSMGQIRNIVLIAGSVVTASGGPFTSLFNYVTRIELQIVPEPSTLGTLAAGGLGLVLLAGIRRRI